MEEHVPRLRLIAGPNGSGKSTIRTYLKDHWVGVYLNADEIEQAMARSTGFDFSQIGLSSTSMDIRAELESAPQIVQQGLAPVIELLNFHGDTISFGTCPKNSYIAGGLVDIARRYLVKRRQTFTFESVMSHPSKLDLLCHAQAAGYRTYLYYVCLEDAEACVDRVNARVREGGHSVSPNKIRQRYHRSLGLLADAIQCSTRAYMFDNTGEIEHVAEVENGAIVEHIESLPDWYVTYVQRKMETGPADQ